jgi:hypothetical protein
MRRIAEQLVANWRRQVVPGHSGGDSRSRASQPPAAKPCGLDAQNSSSMGDDDGTLRLKTNIHNPLICLWFYFMSCLAFTKIEPGSRPW